MLIAAYSLFIVVAVTLAARARIQRRRVMQDSDGPRTLIARKGHAGSVRRQSRQRLRWPGIKA